MGGNDALASSSQSDSLVKRLAGPSAGKAGLAADQREINRVIAEASKGSRFYKNEKKKDQDLTERISKLLKLRDDLCREADLVKIEKTVGQLLLDMEYHRDLSQVIVHVDMDAFFASVEVLYNPSLAGKAFAVGHGVLSTASYEARKFGVRSGMASYIAKKLCPDLILVSSSYDRYDEVSAKVMSIFRRYDPQMAPAGCDEGYMNITNYCQTHNIKPDACVQEIRSTVFSETKLTVSAGIAPNKMLAKICSDKNKPNGQFMIPFEKRAIMDFMHSLPIRKVHGVGRVNERLLDSIGITKCGDIYDHRAILYLLNKQFGLWFLLKIYHGVGSNVVKPHQREETKSVGVERTFRAIDDRKQILDKLEELSEALERDLATDEWSTRTITLKYKLDTYQVFTRARSFEKWVTSKEDIFAVVKELISPEFPIRVRLLGVRATKLRDLRAMSENRGIKRFFASTSEASRKRIKVSDDTNHEESPANEIQLEGENISPGDSAPDFHELDEMDDFLSQQRWRDQDDDENEGEAIVVQGDDRTETQKLPCPICNRTIQTDNDGLNAHIDFCLSKIEILKAQAEANQPIGKSVSTGSRTGKKC